jgi:WD40 repeat protein
VNFFTPKLHHVLCVQLEFDTKWRKIFTIISINQTIKELTDDQSIDTFSEFPNGNLESGGVKEFISIWDLSSEKITRVLNFTNDFPLLFKTACTYSLAVLPDRRLASGHRDGRIRIWTLFG